MMMNQSITSKEVANLGDVLAAGALVEAFPGAAAISAGRCRGLIASAEAGLQGCRTKTTLFTLQSKKRNVLGV